MQTQRAENTTPAAKRTQSLGVILLKVVFSIYMIVTITITSIQMYEEYSFEKQGIVTNLETYQSIFGPAIASALWNLDEEQLKATLDGADRLQDIAGVLLQDHNQETIYHSGVAPSDASQNTFQRNSERNLFYKSFKVSYRDKTIGSLYFYSSNQIIFDKVKYNFLFILVNALIKSLVLWFVFLWAFKRYLVNALDQFISSMKSTDFDRLDEDKTQAANNILLNSTELNTLHAVFHALKNRLKASKQSLVDLNSNLEATVDKRTELLRRQQRVMESMSQQAHIGAWEYDVGSETTFWSAMTREIFEVDANYEPSQRGTLDFFDPESAEQLQALESRAIKEGKPWEVNLKITTARGHKIWICSTGESEIREGHCVRLFGSFQDIDQQIRNNEALQEAVEKATAAAKTKDEFLASMSHEIRTPMNGVIGMLNVLLNNDLNETQKNQANVALRSAESLLLLLNDLLDISRIESGNFKLNHLDFDLYQLLYDQVSLWRTRADDKGIALSLDTSKLQVDTLNGDPHRIQQILSNLMNNAIKFSQEGNIRLLAKSKRIEDGELVTIEVHDEGIGVSEDMQKAIFESFVQADSSSSRQYGGAGLGLSIVRELVNLMGGKVWLKSEQSVGSSFYVQIPLGFPVAKPRVQEPIDEHTDTDPVISETPSDDNARILIVEDNPVNQLVAKAMLDQMGLESDIAEDGIAALEKLNTNEAPYSLILMDCQMPRMDGYETTQAIRQGDAGQAYCPIPIVAMTANAMKGDKEKCLKVGMDDYLSKPITIEMLEDIFNRWIKRD